MRACSSQLQLAPEAPVGTLTLEAPERQEGRGAQELRPMASAMRAAVAKADLVAMVATARAEPAVRQSPSFTPAHGQTIQAVLHC